MCLQKENQLDEKPKEMPLQHKFIIINCQKPAGPVVKACFVLSMSMSDGVI